MKDHSILILALVKFMEENQERRRIVNAAGYTPSDIWNLFWEIAANNQILYDNLYQNVLSFYNEDNQCLDFSGAEQVYQTSNYELFLKEVLRLIDSTIFTDKKLSKRTWKTIESIHQIRERLLCIFKNIGKNNKEEKTMVGFLYAANDERIDNVHKGKGTSNNLIQVVIVAMYVASAIAKRIKEQNIVAGVRFFQNNGKNKGQRKKSHRLSSDTLPEQAIIDLRAKKILLTEEMFTTQETISFTVEIYEKKELVLQEQVNVQRGDFLAIEYPQSKNFENKPSNQAKVEPPIPKEQKHIPKTTAPVEPPKITLKQTQEPQKEQHILSKWFKLKKRIMKWPMFLSLFSVVIIIGISLWANTTPQKIQPEKLPEADMYPCLDGAWLVTPLQGNQSLGVAKAVSDNEYGTKGRLVLMLHKTGEQVVYNFTLNRNTGEVKIGNYQTQIETINKIVKLKFNLQEWKLEKYNL